VLFTLVCVAASTDFDVKLGVASTDPKTGHIFCPYHVTGLHESKPKTIQGTDMTQAFNRARRAISAELQMINRYKGVTTPGRVYVGDLEIEAITGLEEFMEAADGTDYARAFRLALPLAEAGVPSAQNHVGGAYMDGRGIAPDFEKAVRWLIKGSDNCDPGACHNLAAMYGMGWPGVPKDECAARYLFRKAKDFGAFWLICR
jgi:TPR repeat protein